MFQGGGALVGGLVVPREGSAGELDGDSVFAAAGGGAFHCGVVELGAGHEAVESLQRDDCLRDRDERLREVAHWLLQDAEEGGGGEDETGVEPDAADDDTGGEDQRGDEHRRAPQYDDVAANGVHEIGEEAILAVAELIDAPVKVVLPSLELDDAHVVEHLVCGLHALVAHPH